jgi:hypothetical protein
LITWHTRFAFQGTADDLHTPTLGYQIHQAHQIFLALTTVEGSQEVETNHPVLRMWVGHEYALAIYGMLLSDNYIRGRRQADNTMFKIYYMLKEFRKHFEVSYQEPPWMRDADVCRSHRSNLARRQPELYGNKWPNNPENLPYIWPFIDETAPGGYKLMVAKAERDLLAKGERSLPRSIRERISNL